MNFFGKKFIISGFKILVLFFVFFFIPVNSVGAADFYMYLSKNAAGDECECRTIPFPAISFEAARNYLEGATPRAKPCRSIPGGDEGILDKATNLSPGICPETVTTKMFIYHCTVVSPQIDKFNAGDCREFSSPEDQSYDTGRIQCGKTSDDSDKVVVAKGSCSVSGPSGLSEFPGCEDKVKGSVEDLKCRAESLNKAKFSGPADLIGRAIRILLAFVGSITLVLYIYAGILWMTASGASERVETAKKILVWTTLGVVVMLSSYMLASFLFKSLGL